MPSINDPISAAPATFFAHINQVARHVVQLAEIRCRQNLAGMRNIATSQTVHTAGRRFEAFRLPSLILRKNWRHSPRAGPKPEYVPTLIYTRSGTRSWRRHSLLLPLIFCSLDRSRISKSLLRVSIGPGFLKRSFAHEPAAYNSQTVAYRIPHPRNRQRGYFR